MNLLRRKKVVFEPMCSPVEHEVVDVICINIYEDNNQVHSLFEGKQCIICGKEIEPLRGFWSFIGPVEDPRELKLPKSDEQDFSRSGSTLVLVKKVKRGL